MNEPTVRVIILGLRRGFDLNKTTIIALGAVVIATSAVAQPKEGRRIKNGWGGMLERGRPVCQQLHRRLRGQQQLIQMLDTFVQNTNQALSTDKNKPLTWDERNDALKSLGSEKDFTAKCLALVLKEVTPCTDYPYGSNEGSSCAMRYIAVAINSAPFRMCRTQAKLKNVSLWCGLAAEVAAERERRSE